MVRSQTAIVGIGSTPYYKRGRSAPQTMHELVGKATLAALADAGLTAKDVDGFAYFAGGFDTGLLMETLGIPEIRFTAGLTGTGGGSAGAVGLAASAVASGEASVVVVVGGNQQSGQRFGTVTSSGEATPYSSFYSSTGLVGPAHQFALLARRHMHLYGTTREHFGAVAIAMRNHARNNPEALMRTPLTWDEYLSAPVIADPHCLFDCCLESDGAVAVVVTSVERARDLRQKPAIIRACAHGGSRHWGRSIYWMNMPDETFASSGHAPIASRLYGMAGIEAADIDVAQIYDHFTSQVLMQLEDYQFCSKGEGGPFVASGAISAIDGSIPVNTDGGQLSAGYVWGMTHVREAVAQLRGHSANQVHDAELCLVTGGPSVVPVSGLILST